MTTEHPDPRPSTGPSADSRDDSLSAELAALFAQTLTPLASPADEGDDALSGATLSGNTFAGDARTNRFVQKTYRDLQWPALIEALVHEAVTPEGAQILAELPMLSERRLIEHRLAEIAECMELIDTDDEPPLRGLHDIRRALAHAVRGGVLSAEDLEAIGRNGDVAARTQRYFTSRRERAPRFAEAARLLDPCAELRQVLSHAIEPGGRLSERASPDLARLRRAVQNQHDRISTRVDQMLRSSELETSLRDEYFTMREDRYVLPIRVGAKGAVPGIVHGYSASGQTAFIEPNDLIELNNQLRWAQIELAEEENRILQRLSALVARHAGALHQNVEVLAYLDVVTASAKFGRRIRATVPRLSDDGRVALRQARHPLLYLKMERTVDGVRVNDTVPNDISIEPPRKVLIVSGPNTGGKTVALKTVGLCALMVRHGLPLPVEEDSHMALFEQVFTDIGDEQSIERDLSTFSGHVVNINRFLPHCGPESLVLLDELFTGTDPMQGAALAVALLEELAARGATTIVTTHLESLKTLAYESDEFANASMGFDIQTLTPTYLLTMGVPGSSFAVRIAERLGMPDHLVDRARQVLEGQDHHSVEEVLASLEDQMSELQKEQRRLQSLRQEAERARQRYKDKYDALLAREREAIHAETRKLREQLREARDQIRAKLKELHQARVVERADLNQQDLQRMRQELKHSEEILERATERTRPAQAGPQGLVPVDRADVEEGMRVYVQTFKREGTVFKHSPGDNQALVQIGDLKATVDLDKLYYPSEAARRSHVRGGASTNSRGGASSGGSGDVQVGRQAILLPQTADNTCDLRGMRADEAIEKLDFFLDAAYLGNIEGIYIIHGHGTGALKRAVRGHLPQSRYVRDFRRGEREEGGDGVTIAMLKTDGV